MSEVQSPKEALKGTRERLVAALLQQKILDQPAINKALDLQKEKGGSLGHYLVDLGLVKPRILASILSQVLQIPVISLSKMELDVELAKIIPGKRAFQYQIVPISKMGDHLTIAMTDPMDVVAIDYVSQVTGLTTAPLIATVEDVQEALGRLYGRGAMTDTLQELNPQKVADSNIEIISETSKEAEQSAQTPDLLNLTQEGPIVKLTNAILTEAIHLKSSDVLIEAFEKRFRVRYRVDGVFREGESPPVSMHTGVVSRIKVIANLNIAEHRLPQDGRIKFPIDDREVDFRVSVIPSYYGERVCMRVLDKNQVNLDIDRLGFDAEPLKLLKEAVSNPHGLVLITGPTGSGKTTTMYGLLKLVDTPQKNLVTVEDPVEYDLPGINQIAIRAEIGLTFAAALRSILRQDPNVIMVGEIRDNETADISVKAALTGHLVLATLHTNDALSAVARLVNMGIEPYLVASSVLFVGAQRLPRRVCLSCAQPATPPPELMVSLNLPADGKYQKGNGCLMCRGTGLVGRVGLLESISIIPSLRRAVAEGASSMKLRELARGEGFHSLRDYAVAKASAGIIPLEEVARTTVEHQE